MLISLFSLLLLLGALLGAASSTTSTTSTTSANPNPNPNSHRPKHVYRTAAQLYRSGQPLPLPLQHLSILNPERYKHHLMQVILGRSDEGVEEVEAVNPALGKDYWTYMIENFPFFDTPDVAMELTYYFRMFTFLRHIKKREKIENETPESAKLIVTEFLRSVPWEGLDGSIACAAGHHIREGRWMHNHSIMESYGKFWTQSNGGNPRQYSFWLADSLLALCKVTGKE